jgi:UDP-glucose 6-dehydrogenase
VTCVDIDAKKIELLRMGLSPFYEPGINELINEGMRAGRLSFTTNLHEAMLSSDIIFIAAGTPPRADDTSLPCAASWLGSHYIPPAQKLVADCDALFIVTDWQEFCALNLDKLCRLMNGSVLIDGPNIFDPQVAGEAGFQYIGIGT